MRNDRLLAELGNGLDYRIVHDNIGKPRNLKVIEVAAPTIPNEAQKHIDENWNKFITAKPTARNGDITCADISRIDDDGSVLSLPVYGSKFAVLLGTRFNQTPGFGIHTIGAGGITVIKDKGTSYFLFGRRSPNMAYVGGRIEVVPQGLFDKKDIVKENPLDETILREGQEEIYRAAGNELKRENIILRPFCIDITPYWGNVTVDYVLDVENDCLLESFERKDEKEHLVLTPKNMKEHDLFYAVPSENLEEFVSKHLESKKEEEMFGVATRFRLKTYLEQIK